MSGQAARGLAMLLHRLATVAIALAVLAGAGVAVAAWRLSQGPVDLPWLASRLEDAANGNGGPTQAVDRFGRAGLGGVSPRRSTGRSTCA